MSTIFVVLAILSLLSLVISVIKPGKNKKTGKPYKRKDMAIGFGIIFIVFCVLASITAPKTKTVSITKPTANNKHVTNPVAKTAATASTTTSTPAKPVLTGFGASQAEWNKNHTMDTRYAVDSAYDPENDLAGCSKDKYYAMEGTFNYQMCFPNNEPQSVVQANVLQEFPSDTTVLWQQLLTSDSPNECYQMEIHSNTLASVLNGSGNAFIEFSTFEPSDNSGNIDYKTSSVNEATINNINYVSASDSTSC